MDFIFYLDGHSLQEIMRSIVISLGWTYIVLWSLDQQALELACKDGWFNPEMETGSSTARSLCQTLFNLYKLCVFALDAGVPGLALNQLPYVWLTANELLRFSFNESQEEFYKAASIQVSGCSAFARFRRGKIHLIACRHRSTAVFIPCGNGVVELGSTNLVQPDEQNILRISSLLESLMVLPNISVTTPMPGTSISTSTCSSLLSRSVDNHESSSMVSYLQYPTITTNEINIPQDIHKYSMSASELASGFYPYLQTLQLPSSAFFISGHDHETTLVYPDSSQQINVSDMLLIPQTSQASGFPVAPSARNTMFSAFGIWRQPSKVPTPPVLGGQYRLKRGLAILRNIHAERVLGQTPMSGTYRPQGGTVSGSQVNHMISERRRRGKLKEGFEELGSFFPGCTRKDKASILSYTREYLTSLKFRVEELEERNKQMESELKKFARSQSNEGAGTSTALQPQGYTSTEGGDSLVTIEVSKIGGNTTSATASTDEMALEVVVDRPTITINLMIVLLERLREMGVPLISMDTATALQEYDPSTRPQFRMTATIKLQDHEVERLKEGLVSAVNKDGGPPPPSE